MAPVEALTAHKERVHGGHFGSDKGVYAVEDGGQVGKLQFLERQTEKTRETKQLRRDVTAPSGSL